MDSQQVVNSLAATSLANLATVAFAIAWTRLAAGATWSDLGLRFDRALADVRLGLAAFAAISVPIYLLQALLSQFVEAEHPIIELLKEHQQPWVLAMCAFSAVVVAPLAEEFFFRVLLQGWLESLLARTARVACEVPAETAERREFEPDRISPDEPGASQAAPPPDHENPYAAPGSLPPALTRQGRHSIH